MQHCCKQKECGSTASCMCEMILEALYVKKKISCNNAWLIDFQAFCDISVSPGKGRLRY